MRCYLNQDKKQQKSTQNTRKPDEFTVTDVVELAIKDHMEINTTKIIY